MSQSLSDAAIAEFDATIKHAYQDMGKLRPTVTVKSGVVASTYRFPKLGKGQASQRIPQTDVVPMNLAHTNRIATLTKWNAAEFTDIFDESQTNIDEKGALGHAIAGAITRRDDQLLIDGLEAASSTLTVAASVGGSNTGLNVAKLRRGQRLLGDGGVDTESESLTYVGVHYGKEDMLGQTEPTSVDFNAIRALVNGTINDFMGYSFKWIATRAEGGLTLTGNSRTNFAYVPSAMGLASGIEFRTEVNYIPIKTSWLANGLFTAGAIDIDALGIVELTTFEA